jgi:L-ribulose-5-phosphate 3-epimerase
VEPLPVVDSSVLGVCSWSLQPADPDDLLAKLAAVGLSSVQLALKPFHGGGLLGPRGWDLKDTARRLADAGVTVRSAMYATRGEDYSSLESIKATGGVRSDEHWTANLALAEDDAKRCRQLGVGLVTFHAGFLPHERNAPLRAVMLDRLRQVVDRFDDQGVRVGFETGQESADTLLGVLAELDRPRAGVNFDPANMLLYGMGDPVDALRRLLPHVRQVHVKDALTSAEPGEWGAEVPVGDGGVDWGGFFTVLASAPRVVDLMIEREAGDQRVTDVRLAAERVGPRLAGLAGDSA